jgi:hypothetical protein
MALIDPNQPAVQPGAPVPAAPAARRTLAITPRQPQLGKSPSGGWDILKNLQNQQRNVMQERQAPQPAAPDGRKYPMYNPGVGQIHGEYNQKIDDHIKSLGYQPGMRPEHGGAPNDVVDAARAKFDVERNAAVQAYKAAHPKPRAVPKQLSIGQKFQQGLHKIPVAAQVAHAVINPITGVPAAIAGNWDSVKKFGGKVKNFGKRVVGGLSDAFRRKK